MIETRPTSSNSSVRLEVCVDTPDGLAAAAEAGADRCELCAGLDLGGLTPGPGLLAAARDVQLPVHVLVRPRAGDFVASEADLAAMIADVEAVRAAGLAGVVVGAALRSGALDTDALAALVEAAGPMEVTLHRVVDLAPDPLAAVETAVGLGLRRILTSGGVRRAVDGAERIAAMVRQAAGRIEIMAGGGVTPEAAPTLLATGVQALHASCATVTRDDDGFGRTRATDRRRIEALRRAMIGTEVPA